MSFATSYRTHTCGDLRAAHLGQTVTLCGWINSRRDHGGIIFIDLRDRYGLTQIACDPHFHPASWQQADAVRPEFVLRVTGVVKHRPAGQENPKLATGEVEVYVNQLEIVNASLTPPFEIDQDKVVNEEVRLKYRYLDLRHERLQRSMALRHRIIKYIRDYMDRAGFLEIETPILIKSTPEGSREYLVPSRVHPGKFYVLPQSPQQLKQLLMVAGFDRYFQIARCFRDEDQRGDRQPEFTQLDVEMSFVREQEVMQITETLMTGLVAEFVPAKRVLQAPFPVLTWQQAMERYGSDKPDLRFGLDICDVSATVKDCGFKVFADAMKNNGVVKALRVPNGAEFSRGEIDQLTELAKIFGAKGLAYFVYSGTEIKSPVRKFLTDAETAGITAATGAQPGDIVFFAADRFSTACTVLGQVRLACAARFHLQDPELFAFCWVHDFPLFESDPETGDMAAVHHPFTRPLDADRALLESDPLAVRAQAYDIILNGNEVGGGSIRIHEQELQQKIFSILKISPADAEERFGHLLQAFQFGAPPHGGIAWGLDRLVMLFANELNIREVIAFPKDQKARDLIMNAPSAVTEKQLRELHIRTMAPAPDKA
jgi:aspartyl-tRNA synthetase